MRPRCWLGAAPNSDTDPRDGVIEAIERPDKRFVVGVQWHPENQIGVKDAIARKLFESFAAALISV